MNNKDKGAIVFIGFCFSIIGMVFYGAGFEAIGIFTMAYGTNLLVVR